ncbi:hypothetical protein IFM89_025745 [Coptis chinensis]|uniref:Uncharacterized protein n=1 Tax=Coptis chinensis TaxID=261450 RepID=A0A835I3H5_9MAGN|nr:hypothetical protein IFM89_025745 [Coptis chinensis]
MGRGITLLKDLDISSYDVQVVSPQTSAALKNVELNGYVEKSAKRKRTYQMGDYIEVSYIVHGEMGNRDRGLGEGCGVVVWLGTFNNFFERSRKSL